MYLDAINQPLAPGDWVVYAKSNYARIAKILNIQQKGNGYQTRGGTAYDWEIQLLTVSGNKTLSRTVTSSVGRPAYAVLRIDCPPREQENLIEQRLARKK